MDPATVIALSELLEKGGPWTLCALLIVALVCLWKVREKDNRDHYETAIRWAEQGATREAKLAATIETLTRAFGAGNA